MGGKFTLSDDSHGIDHVGLNFHRAIQYLEDLGVEEMCYLERKLHSTELPVASIPLQDLKGNCIVQPNMSGDGNQASDDVQI